VFNYNGRPTKTNAHEMSLENRLKIYRRLEQERGRPLIVFVTGDRKNAEAGIASDAVRELLYQLQKLPRDTEDLDLLLVSLGGHCS